MAQEVQWFFLKVVPDAMRQEPRNMGLVVRLADERVVSRFWGEPRATVCTGGIEEEVKRVSEVSLPDWLRLDADPGVVERYIDVVAGARKALLKYGAKAMNWLPKKYGKGNVYLHHAGTRLTSGLNFDEMWTDLVV